MDDMTFVSLLRLAQDADSVKELHRLVEYVREKHPGDPKGEELADISLMYATDLIARGRAPAPAAAASPQLALVR